MNKMKLIEFEQKEAIIIYSITEGIKRLGKSFSLDNEIALCTSQEPLKQISEPEILSIIKGFEIEKKLIIKKRNLSIDPVLKLNPLTAMFEEKYFYISINNIDKNFFLTRYESVKNLLIDNKQEKQSKSFFIDYTQDRRILLNGKIELGKPDFNSENDLFFDFLFNHPNEIISKTDIEKNIHIKLHKDVDKIIENLGFIKGLKKTFFDINKDQIKFKKMIKL